MLTWLRDNVDLLNMAGSLGMLAIWLLYLQLFYRSYRRQREPNLLIHQANGFDLDSMCMIANMSASNVHIEALLVDAVRGEDHVSFQPAPTTPDPVHADDPLRDVHTGPLNQGTYLTVGTFRTLVAEAEARLPDPSGDASLDLTIRLVAFVGPELQPIGARRTFDVTGSADGAEVRPRSLLPEQLSSRRQRRIARQWLVEAQALDLDRVVTYEEEERSVRRLQRRMEHEREMAASRSRDDHA